MMHRVLAGPLPAPLCFRSGFCRWRRVTPRDARALWGKPLPLITSRNSSPDRLPSPASLAVPRAPARSAGATELSCSPYSRNAPSDESLPLRRRISSASKTRGRLPDRIALGATRAR